MAKRKSVALASISTYSDSDYEEDHETQGSNVSDHSSKNRPIEESQTPPVPLSSLDMNIMKEPKHTKLVSYNFSQGSVISDNENNAERQMSDENDGKKLMSTEDLADKDDIQLPPEPSGSCSNELQKKISKLHEKMAMTGLDMNKVIQERKSFKNPSMYEKLVQFCDIDEFGTNFSPEVYDPTIWGPESYYEELAKAQQAEMDRREKERKRKTKVEYVTGTAKGVKGTSSKPGCSKTDNDSKRRKPKWDQVELADAETSLKPVTLAQPTILTTSVTGTKGTVIPEFKSLPKNPRL